MNIFPTDRPKDKDFLMPVEDVFYFRRGTVATGRAGQEY